MFSCLSLLPLGVEVLLCSPLVTSFALKVSLDKIVDNAEMLVMREHNTIILTTRTVMTVASMRTHHMSESTPQFNLDVAHRVKLHIC